MKLTTRKLTYSALMMALVFVFTFTIKVPTFTGYIHLGDAMVLLSGLLLGPLYGALAAGLGSMLSDILGGYVQWALPTLIIKGSMAFIVGLLASKKQNRSFVLFSGFIFSAIWVAFNAILYQKIVPQVGAKSEEIVTAMELSDAQELMTMTTQLKTYLLWGSVIVPILILSVLILLKYKKIANFSPVYSMSFVISGSLMVVLYYFTEYLLYGNYITATFGIPFNLIQFTAGLILAHLLLPVIQKFKLTSLS